MIVLHNVSKSYNKGSKLAVDSLNLQIKPGEIFGFLGPNGAGKTTTIKMIVGLLQPDAGTITVGGVDVRRDPLAAKAQIGFVPDTPEVWDKLTGLEYLNFLADVYRVPPVVRRQRIAEIAEEFELTGALGDPIGSFSHGMQQKLVLLGALMHRPPVWILDEPMVGLDPRSAHKLKELMADHCRQGNTVFFSTHVLEVAERLCHRVGIIRKGRLIAEGTVEALQQARGESGETLEQIFLELTEQ